MIKIQENKLYLVTGGTGFLGDPLVNYILLKKGKVRVMSRNEGKLIMLKEKYPEVEIYPGDISDICDVTQATKDVTGIFHLAASKHVGLSEIFVRETLKTNTLGTLNLLESTMISKVEFILAISTDKAAQVVGVYGASKFLMEKLMSQYEKLNPSCAYRIVRYGNVLYSTGSVLCKWKELIENGQQVIVTDDNATRFFWSIEQAIDLIVSCMENAVDSTPYCPDMKSMSIKNLLQAMVEKYGNGKKIEVKKIGLQPGENLHEKILENGLYSNEVDQFTIEEIKKII